MNTSLFELFKIGIGPSSSHTVGPLHSASHCVHRCFESIRAPTIRGFHRIQIALYGSLALTGIGHGTDRAVLLGLLGEAPDTVDPTTVESSIATIRSTGQLILSGSVTIPFTEQANLQ